VRGGGGGGEGGEAGGGAELQRFQGVESACETGDCDCGRQSVVKYCRGSVKSRATVWTL